MLMELMLEWIIIIIDWRRPSRRVEAAVGSEAEMNQVELIKRM